MSQKPLIGLTMHFDSKGTYYSELPWCALRENHCTTVMDAGGIPLGLPYDVDAIDTYLNTIDGLIVTGGNFDVDPKYYGEAIQSGHVTPMDQRTKFEFEITQKALARNMPVLGICGGEQLLNVILGGTLIQHIPDDVPNAHQHEQPGTKTVSGHTVDVVENTLLSQCVQGQKTLHVNTSHHQAVKDTGPGVVINAHAPDGIIEGIEHPDYKFCLGVQWHPEFSISPADDMITKAFVTASQS